nr:hypothetical protein [Tanacetum cinerariifolium]
LRDDHGASSGPTVGGKSQSSIKRLFARAVKNDDVKGGDMPTLPFVTYFIFTTSKREGEDHTKLLARANLRTIGAPQRFVISSDSSDHSDVNIAKAEVDSVVKTSVPIIMSATTTPTADLAAIAKEKLVGSSVFGFDSLSVGESHPIPGGFSDCTGSDFLIGGIRTVIDPDSNLQKVYVPQWNVTNGSCLDDGGVYREMVDESPPNFFASVRGMKHEQLFTEFNVGAARQMSLSAEVRMRAEYNIREMRRLNSVVEENDALLKAKDEEIGSLKAQLVHKLEASSARLQEKVTVYENCLSQLEKFQDDRMRKMNDKFDKLDTDLFEMALHLEERFYPHLLTTIFRRGWLLTHGLELPVAKCLNSTKYLSTLGAAIGKAVEKGIQDGLSAGLTHAARVLKSNKDASIDTIMNLLRLEDSLVEKLGLTESQSHVDQLMVHIHHSLDQRVVGASALSLSLDVSSFRVRRIKKIIAKHRSALRDVFVPLSEPLSVTALTGTESTSNVIPATVDTTTTLSVTSVSASLITPISIDDYEITHAEGEKSAFLDVDDAKLNIPQ